MSAAPTGVALFANWRFFVADDKQKTQPKGKDKRTGEPHKPIEIPVPKRREFFQSLKQAARDEIVRRTSTKK